MSSTYNLIRWIARNVILSNCKDNRIKRVIIRDDLDSVWMNLTIHEIVDYQDISKSLCAETCKFVCKTVLYIVRDLIGMCIRNSVREFFDKKSSVF